MAVKGFGSTPERAAQRPQAPVSTLRPQQRGPAPVKQGNPYGRGRGR